MVSFRLYFWGKENPPEDQFVPSGLLSKLLNFLPNLRLSNLSNWVAYKKKSLSVYNLVAAN